MTAPAQSSGRRLGVQLGMQPPQGRAHDPQYVPPPAPMAAAGPRVVPPPAHMRPGPKVVPRVVPPRVQNAGMPREPTMPPKAKWAQQAQQAHLNIAMAAAREQARSAADWALAQKELDEHQQALDDAASDEEAEFLLAQHQAEEDAAAYNDGEAELAADSDDAEACELAAGETRHWHGQPCDYAEWDAAHEAWKAAEPAAHETWETAEPDVQQEVIGKPMRARDKRGSVTRGGRHVQAKRKADLLGEGGIKLFMAYQCAEQHALDDGLPSRTFVEWQRDNRAGRNVGSSAATTWFGDAANYTWGSSSNYTCGGSSSSSAGRATKRRRDE